MPGPSRSLLSKSKEIQNSKEMEKSHWFKVSAGKLSRFGFDAKLRHWPAQHEFAPGRTWILGAGYISHVYASESPVKTGTIWVNWIWNISPLPLFMSFVGPIHLKQPPPIHWKSALRSQQNVRKQRETKRMFLTTYNQLIISNIYCMVQLHLFTFACGHCFLHKFRIH